MQKDKQFYNDFFSKFGASVHDDPVRFQKIAELCKGRVLDVACGSGTLSDYFSGEYTGLDISDVAIKQAKSVRRKDASFFVADILKSNLETSIKYDTVVMAEFLEHIENDALVFEKALTILKPGGRIICSVPNGEKVPDESHCRVFTVPEIRKNYAKYGNLRFFNWSGVKNRLIFTIEPGKKAENEMTLVIIAKDEEKGLETAILSALELVSGVVVAVDNATTDKTAEVAKLYADQVLFFDWHDNFSEARNFASKDVKTKWILFLDGHEYIEKYGRIADYLGGDYDGILVTGRLENGFEFHYPRIYKTGLQFMDAVHNNLKLQKPVNCFDFVFVHDRKNLQSAESSAQRIKQKDEMMPRLLKDMLKKDKKNTRALFHLAQYYMTLENWKEAIYYSKKYLKYSQVKQEIYLVHLNIGVCYQAQKKLLRAVWKFKDANKILPGRWETALLLGGVYMMFENYALAANWLTAALDENKRHYLYNPFPRSLAQIWDMLHICYYQLGKIDEAIIACQEAIKNSREKIQQDVLQTKLYFLKLYKAGGNEARA